MLETINPQEDTEELFKKLNPMTNYKLGISDNLLLNKTKWHIIGYCIPTNVTVK